MRKQWTNDGGEFKVLVITAKNGDETQLSVSPHSTKTFNCQSGETFHIEPMTLGIDAGGSVNELPDAN